MITQAEIQFPVLTPQNNKQSEEILLQQEKRLSKNCQTLFDAFMRGEKLTGEIIVTRYNMLEYRRRIKDLKAAGVPVQDEVMENGCKCWWVDRDYFKNLY